RGGARELRVRDLLQADPIAWTPVRGSPRSSTVGLSSWHLCTRDQVGQVIVHARYREVRLALEGLADVVDAMRVAVEELHNGKNEALGLVEGVEDLVAGHGDRVRAGDTTLDLDEAQLARPGDAALDVVAELLEFAVGRLEAETAFDPHDDGSCACGADLRINGSCRRRCPTRHGREQARRHHQ